MAFLPAALRRKRHNSMAEAKAQAGGGGRSGGGVEEKEEEGKEKERRQRSKIRSSGDCKDGSAGSSLQPPSTSSPSLLQCDTTMEDTTNETKSDETKTNEETTKCHSGEEKTKDDEEYVESAELRNRHASVPPPPRLRSPHPQRLPRLPPQTRERCHSGGIGAAGKEDEGDAG